MTKRELFHFFLLEKKIPKHAFAFREDEITFYPNPNKAGFFLVQRPKTSIYVGIENQSIRSETDIDLVQINRLFQLQNQKGP